MTEGLKRLVGIRGRAPRFAYWGVIIVGWVGTFAFATIAGVGEAGFAVLGGWYIVIGYIYMVVAACRARDMGKSGWMAFATLIPIVGIFVVFWLGFGRPAERDTDQTGE